MVQFAYIPDILEHAHKTQVKDPYKRSNKVSGVVRHILEDYNRSMLFDMCELTLTALANDGRWTPEIVEVPGLEEPPVMLRTQKAN